MRGGTALRTGVRVLGAGGLLCAALAGPLGAGWAASPEPLPPEVAGMALLRIAPGQSYVQWRAAEGWEDRRPLSDSTERFRIEDGTLRLESAGDSFLIGRQLRPEERHSLQAFPFLRFTARIARVPRGARLMDEVRDDSALRVYVLFDGEPVRALVYVWSWELPVGDWSARGRSFWGDFRGVHRKAFGRGNPTAEQWFTVELNLARDFAARFPGAPLPVPAGLALKADSNNTPEADSLAWIREVRLAQRSLAEAGYREGDRLDAGGRETVVWFR